MSATSGGAPFWRPGPLQKRIRAATSIFQRFWKPFWSAAPRQGGERVRLVFSSIFRPPYPPARPKNAFKIRENLRLSKKIVFFWHKNSASISGHRFFWYFSDFGWILVPILDAFWYHFPYFLHHFFGYRFCIDFVSTFHAFLSAQNHVFYCKTNSFEHFSLFQKSFWDHFWH